MIIIFYRYCECFASKLYCDDCNCVGCCNTPENQQLVQKAVSATLERNPKAFKDKIKFQTVTVRCYKKGHNEKIIYILKKKLEYR